MGFLLRKVKEKRKQGADIFFLKTVCLAAFLKKFFGTEMREINDKKPNYSIFRLNQFEIRIAFFIKND